jgi:hypothetical protein
MASVVGVHGINQQLKGPNQLVDEWLPTLQDGVQGAKLDVPPVTLACAFYGGLFRAPGQVRSVGDPHYRPSDVSPDEAELLMLLWNEAARLEPKRVAPPEADRRTTSSAVQVALRVLARSRFFAGMAERAFIGALKQVRRYLRESEIRTAAQDAVNAVVTAETRVIVAHSLGSVVAYECLCRFADQPHWTNVKTFVTLGSPLGIPNLIFHALQPSPKDGRGAWPGRVERWTNISDDGDVVALLKKLGPLFAGQIVDVRIDNESKAHDIMPYLTASETGLAVAYGLR